MQRISVLVCLALLALAHACHPTSAGDEKAALEVKYRYLVVEAVGPAEWQKKHTFSIRWQGKDVNLPVVFRAPGRAENFDLGSAGELSGHLQIGKNEVPVTCKPETKFQVRNTGDIGMIPEKSSNKDTVAFSIVTSVALSPPEFRTGKGPELKKEEIEAAGKTFEKRVKELIAAGRMIEVTSEKKPER
jgi:hypothetical protein